MSKVARIHSCVLIDSRRTVWRLDLVILGMATIVVILILCAPVLAASGHPALATAVYAAFRPLCHQRADRSLFIEGLPMAVCSRCFGIYFGFWLGMLTLILSASPKYVSISFRSLVLTMLPMTADALGGWAGLFTNTHLSRWMTGLIAGAGVALFIFGLDLRRKPRDE